MFKKTILCGALAFAAINPLALNAAAQTSATMQDAAADTAITAKIKSLYMKSPLLNSLDISVTTNNQNVMLKGNVTTDLEYEKAIALADSVKNVKDVNADELIVKSSKSPLADTYITAKVKGTLMKEKMFGKKNVEYWPVKVETKDGVVYLTGKVNNQAQLNNIVNLVKTINGVKSVNSTLTTKK